jgi:hypothetical protein
LAGVLVSRAPRRGGGVTRGIGRTVMG